MENFVTAQNILVSQHAATREEILHIISQRAQDLGITDDADAAYKGFKAREDIDKTGMMEGFAVPHCKSSAVKRPAIFLLKNETAIEWPSFDDKPVDIALALLVPDAEAGTTHVRLLSKAAVLLMKEDFKREVRASNDPQVIADLLNAGIED